MALGKHGTRKSPRSEAKQASLVANWGIPQEFGNAMERFKVMEANNEASGTLASDIFQPISDTGVSPQLIKVGAAWRSIVFV